MELLHESLKKYLAEKIFSAINSGFTDCQLTVSDIYAQLAEPPPNQAADYAFGCFQLSKTLRLAPPAIAKKLEELMAQNVGEQNDKILSAKAVGPYLNLSLTAKGLGEEVLKPILSGEYFKRHLTADTPKTMIEFSQPNTHKELHVGHMRNLCLGDSLVRMLRYAGHDVVSSTFPGDQGTHVAKCLWYLKFHNKESIPKENKGEWIGRIYSKAHLKLEDELGTPQEEKNREQLTLILKELENQKGEYFELWKETREWSVELMKSVYDWAGVKFDVWYWESEVDAASLALAKKLFSEGKLIKSEGAVGMDLSSDNLGFCMLLKSDGTGLYATKDIELARRKFEDFEIEKSIYVVDVRQALHFKQVFKTLEVIGFKQASKCFHLQYNFVELPDGAMSSRKGNIVPLTDLVHQMEDTIKTDYLSRYAGEWTVDEINKTATQVAIGAIKYGMLRMDTNKKIVFDMKEWIKLDGESGPFIQYSYARINSLSKKIEKTAKNLNWDLLQDPSEKVLATALMHFNSVMVASAETYKPAALCNYLYELARKFNVFYHQCPIAKAPSDELRDARLALSTAAGLVIKAGLDNLGIPVPDRM